MPETSARLLADRLQVLWLERPSAAKSFVALVDAFFEQRALPAPRSSDDIDEICQALASRPHESERLFFYAHQFLRSYEN
jgi:hypothetical protein